MNRLKTKARQEVIKWFKQNGKKIINQWLSLGKNDSNFIQSVLWFAAVDDIIEKLKGEFNCKNQKIIDIIENTVFDSLISIDSNIQEFLLQK